MNRMFNGAKSFNQDISGWNTQLVEDMNSMFRNANKFNKPISDWNTEKAENMGFMFNLATEFDQDISGWNTAAVTNMEGMFLNAEAFNQDLHGWNVEQIATEPVNFRESASSWTGQDANGDYWCNRGKPQWGTSGSVCLDCSVTDWDAVEGSDENKSAFQCLVDGQKYDYADFHILNATDASADICPL